MTTSDGEGAVQAIQRRCKFCASPIGSEVTTCPRCGVVNQLAGVDVAAKPPREEPRNFGFNWGACCVPVLWFSGHGKVYFTIGLVLLMILQVHKLLWPAWLLAHVVFGFIGNKIAWQYHDAESKAEVKELERWWNIGGLIALLPTAFIIAKMLAKAGR